jgi:GTP-binding protein
LKIKSCRFDRAAARAADEPKTSGPHIVLLGRSNVGKSSLINRLLGVKSPLARTSSEPGRTQALNFYRINEEFHIVDLPGYGYARVPEPIRRAWKPMIEGYLERHRDDIALAILVIDARRDPTALDRTMRDWLGAHEVAYVVAATKTDTLGMSERARTQREIASEFGDALTLFVSSKSGLGLRELWRRLDAALESRVEPERKIRA